MRSYVSADSGRHGIAHDVRYAVMSPESAILFSTDHEFIGWWGGEHEV